MSLFFLYGLSPDEALTVLEERLHLVTRSQALLTGQAEYALTSDDLQPLVIDHMRILLAAEHEWVQRAILHFQQQSRLQALSSI